MLQRILETGERMGMKVRVVVAWLALSLCGLIACSSRSSTVTSSGTGTLYYTTQGDSSIWSYTVALSNGSLTQVGGTGSTGSFPVAMVLAPSLNAMFVANQASDTVSAYTVNSDGSLTTATGTAKTGSMPMGMATDPAGKFLFVANQGSNNVSVYTISSTTLKEISGSPFTTIPAGTVAPTGPTGVVVSATGDFLYVSNSFVGTVSAFKIGSTGALSVVGGSPYAVGTGPAGLAIPPNGAFLYVANSGSTSNSVSAFFICDKVVTSCPNPNSPDGTLSPVNGSPFAAGLGPVAIAIDPSFHFLYVLDKQSSEISEYSYGTGNGVLSILSPPTVSTGQTPTSMVVITGTTGSNIGNTLTNPTDYVYVTNNAASTLSAFTLNTTTGVLTPLGQAITTTTNPSAIAAN